MIHEMFGDFIKNARTSKGINGVFVAKKASITRASLYNIEYGVNIPRIDTFFKLLEAVGETMESFSEYTKKEGVAA